MSKPALSKVGLDRMHEVMAGHVEHGGVPGIVTLVSRRGEVHVDAHGTMAMGGEGGRGAARLDLPRRVDDEAGHRGRDDDPRRGVHAPTRRAGRPLAAGARGPARCCDRSTATLDDTVPAARPITVRDLLTFRMGARDRSWPRPTRIRSRRALAALRARTTGHPHPQTPPAPDEWIRRFGTLPLLHQPGEQWMYNTSADVLGVLVARASGQVVLGRSSASASSSRSGCTTPVSACRRTRSTAGDRVPEQLRDRRARAARRSGRRPVESGARVPVGCGRIGVDRRRLRRVRPDAVERVARSAERAHPVAAFGRADDVGSADTRGKAASRGNSSPASSTPTAGASA